MKQTAVEWLVEKLDQNFDYVADTIIEQAKAMEKEQSERMYSEEDLRNAYRWGTTVNHGTKEHFNEWFEQLKKKSYDQTTNHTTDPHSMG
jgi:hypothetical protein